MQLETIIALIVLGATILASALGIVVAIVRGKMKEFIKEKMIEAEKLEMSGVKKLEYVLQAVKEKYKVLELALNVKKFIEQVISISKQINAK